MLLYLWYSTIILVGVALARLYGRLVSFLAMIEMYQVGIFVLGWLITGQINFVLLIPGIGVLPRIGRYSGVSAGGLVPPLIFLLVAIVTPRERPRGADLRAPGPG